MKDARRIREVLLALDHAKEPRFGSLPAILQPTEPLPGSPSFWLLWIRRRGALRALKMAKEKFGFDEVIFALTLENADERKQRQQRLSMEEQALLLSQ